MHNIQNDVWILCVWALQALTFGFLELEAGGFFHEETGIYSLFFLQIIKQIGGVI